MENEVEMNLVALSKDDEAKGGVAEGTHLKLDS